MALRAGERLGPYEILGGLGAGGMGEVYRARDPRLQRTVAIKVLPAAVSADPARRQRFEHEARAAGQLNHPNVLAVYDVGDREGVPYLVAELLEGETLRERLQAGALPVRKAADHALQVARGLAAAHDKGIVHRDLKPENLFLTKDGLVKILDFGLARLERTPEPGSEATATVTSGTDPGTVMGTVGYMSPEQVRGEPADHRSDLFALGAVLYEMLTGARAFHRDTSVETLNAILKEEPAEFPPDRQIPPALDRVIRHCLEKKPEDRFQSARDLAFELEGLTGSSVTAAKAAAPAIGRRRRWLIGAVVGLLALAALAGSFLVGRGSAPARIPTYRQITFGRGVAPTGRFTPDGRTVVYSAAWNGGRPEIYSVATDSTEAKPLGLPHGHVAAISAKGELAMLLTTYPLSVEQPATLARVSLSGGVPRPVAEEVWCADWAPDGETLAVSRAGGGSGPDRVSGGERHRQRPGRLSPVLARRPPSGLVRAGRLRGDRAGHGSALSGERHPGAGARVVVGLVARRRRDLGVGERRGKRALHPGRLDDEPPAGNRPRSGNDHPLRSLPRRARAGGAQLCLVARHGAGTGRPGARPVGVRPYPGVRHLRGRADGPPEGVGDERGDTRPVPSPHRRFAADEARTGLRVRPLS